MGTAIGNELEKGIPFVAAQTFIPREQGPAAVLVDSLTSRYGTAMPRFEEGWLARAIDPDLPKPRVIEDLRTNGEVVDVGRVPIEAVQAYVGPRMVAEAFRQET